jgi:cephalosporin-C deacetylase
MALINEFDKFFLNLPPFDRENDFEEFWKNSIANLKAIPIEPEIVPAKKTIHQGFESFRVEFRGFHKSIVTGLLAMPAGLKKPRTIISIGDYNMSNPHVSFKPDKTISYFYLNLRGHEILKFEKTAPDGEKPGTPGYMSDNIADADNFYMMGIYLDAYRSIEMLRLSNKVDCSAVGMIGKGIGAAAAVFAASQSPRIRAIVLETPAFSHLPKSQNLSESDATAEINTFLSRFRTKSKLVKKNLTYYDAINFSDMIKCPVMVTTGFKDALSPPECVFSLFNHFLCDKTIEVYPDEGNDAGGEKQYKKSIKWIIEQLYNN